MQTLNLNPSTAARFPTVDSNGSPTLFTSSTRFLEMPVAVSSPRYFCPTFKSTANTWVPPVGVLDDSFGSCSVRPANRLFLARLGEATAKGQ